METLPLPLTVKIIYEPEAKGSEYVAYSPEFEVASCGPTEEKARKNLQEAIELVIEVAADEGTLDDLLETVGFRAHKKGWLLPKVTFESFFLPIPEVLKGRIWTSV